MLKKLVSALALTGLAFGSGLCFNPYNHNYGIGFGLKGWGFHWGNEAIILHNGKMHVSKERCWIKSIKLIKYIVKNNKALVLMDASAPRLDGGHLYFLVYTNCMNRKPVTEDIEALGFPTSQSGVVNIPRYPIKFGFYKDGFWAKYLYMAFQNGWYHHPGGERCDYETDYFPYKLIKEHKGYEGPSKDQFLPNRVCNALATKLGM